MIYIGTAGYSYKDWIGPVYPQGTRDGDMLEYYAKQFSFVEVNSTYYHMPGRRLFDSINRKTPDHFRLAAKLFKGFTHERNGSAEEADKFKYSVAPVKESGKLLCLLAQFPYSFHFTKANAEYLKHLREWFKDEEINVEFRNQKWICEGTMRFLKEQSLGFVCVDEPQINGLVKGVTAATSRVAYLRLHGRNAAQWYEGEGSQRYDYLYSGEELREWLPRIWELESHSGYTVISFNNHPVGKAVVNARMMEQYLQSLK